MANDLNPKGVVERLKQAGAFEVRVADPHVGFEHILEGNHPLNIWEECRSVVVFAIASSPRFNNLYCGPYAPARGNRQVGPVPQYIQSDDFAMDRLCRLVTASITLKGIGFLQTLGCRVIFSKAALGVPLLPQLKLLAYEAGIGVYGRSGQILNPVLGNRLRLGAFLTDAVLEPNGRLEEYNPCQDCDLCIRACPAKAFDPDKNYPESWSFEKCVSKRDEIELKGLYCHNCFAFCPAGTLKDDELLRVEEAESFFRGDRE